MAVCGIMRIEKRGRGAIYGLQIEANRKREDHDRGRDFDKSDIDWDKTDENIHLVKTENWNKEITRQIREAGVKERKNSTVMLDGLYTASSGWFKSHTNSEILAFFKDCLDFHVQEYCMGDKSRIINAIIHLDETTPHMQVASIPIFRDNHGMHLSAKILCGGRSDFRIHQDNFYKSVSIRYGMDRGDVKDWPEIKAHTTKREYQIASQESSIVKQNIIKESLEADVERLKIEARVLTDKVDKSRQEASQAEQMEAYLREEVNSLSDEKNSLNADIWHLKNEVRDLAAIGGAGRPVMRRPAATRRC